jgi:hypothetical protein
MSFPARKSGSSDTEQRQWYIELSTRLSELALSEGIRITPFRDARVPHFMAASTGQREHVLTMLKQTLELVEEIRGHGDVAGKSAALIWAFCRIWKCTPASDFLGKIDEGCSVDLYNVFGQLIFANLRFYSLTSYSLDELYFLPWEKLYTHEPPEIQEKLKNICAHILKGPHQLHDVRHLGPHLIRETLGKGAGIIEPTYFTSLAKSGKIIGFACINRIVEVHS